MTGYKNIILNQLGNIIVVDTMKNANIISKKINHKYRIVTLDGEILSPQGSMSGGSKKSNDSSLLSKDNEINALKENIKKLKTKTKHEHKCKNYKPNFSKQNLTLNLTLLQTDINMTETAKKNGNREN